MRALTRRLMLLAGLGASVHFVLPQLANAGATARSVGQLRWSWVTAVSLAAGLTYAMAALSLMAASGVALGFGRTMSAQLAAAFTNRFVPAGVGAMATNVRYLERAGSSRPAALTAVGLDSMAGFVVHASGLAAVAALFRSTHQHFSVHSPDVPDNWWVLVLIAVALSGCGIALALARLRGRFSHAARSALDQLRALIRDHSRGRQLLAASAGVTAAYVLALYAAARAAGGAPSVVSVAAVYLGGSALAAASPTPGGLGAVEASLIAGLTSVGQPAAAAVTTVLAFRIITYWLPVLPGAVSFWALRRAELL